MLDPVSKAVANIMQRRLNVQSFIDDEIVFEGVERSPEVEASENNVFLDQIAGDVSDSSRIMLCLLQAILVELKKQTDLLTRQQAANVRQGKTEQTECREAV